MPDGNNISMRTPVFNFVVLFRLGTALCCLSALLLCGCAILFGDRHSLITTVPTQSPSPASFKAVLPMSTTSIEFDWFQDGTGTQRLQISVINRGRFGFLMKHADGKFAPVIPNTRVDLYIGEITRSTNSLHLRVSGVQSRTPCEFQVEVSNPSHFRNPVRVYVFSSSAPM